MELLSAFGKYTLWEIILFFQVHIRKRVGGSYRLTWEYSEHDLISWNREKLKTRSPLLCKGSGLFYRPAHCRDSLSQRKSQRGHQGNKAKAAGLMSLDWTQGTVLCAQGHISALPLPHSEVAPEAQGEDSSERSAAGCPGYSCQQEGRNFLGMFFLEVKSPFPLGQWSLLPLELRGQHPLTVV